MADLITHGLTFTKESVTEYFLKPLFVESDIRQVVEVRDDIKTGEKLDMVDTLQKITKGYAQGESFTPSTGVTITQKTITVVTMKAEVHQNGRAFLNYVKQQALKSGYSEDDITGTVFEEIVLAVFMRALMADLQRQVFFGDTTKEVIVSSAPNGTLDEHYKEYNGLWTRVIADFNSGAINASQKVDMNVTALQTTVGVAAVDTVTLTGTSGTANVTINGVAYLATFDTDLTTTAANFVTDHAATILARYGACVVTSSGADIIITSGLPGMDVTSAVANVSGNLAGSVANTTAAVQNTTLKTDAAKTAMASMYAKMPPELRALKALGLLRFMVTSSMYDNYLETLEALNGSEAAHYTLVDGVQMLKFRGVPIVERMDWGVHIEGDFGNVRPHRAMLTVPNNLIVGTDSTNDDVQAEMWYDQNTQTNRFRVQYKIGTQYLHDKFVVAAF